MNSNLYSVPYLQNNTYLYPSTQIQNLNTLPHRTQPIEIQGPGLNFKDEPDLAQQRDLKKPCFSSFESKPQEVFSSETFQSKPLNEVKPNFENYRNQTANCINETKNPYQKFEVFEIKDTNKENNWSQSRDYAFQAPSMAGQKVFKPNFGYVENKNNRIEEGYVLPSFRSDNYHNMPEKIHETFADSLRNELERSQNQAKEFDHYREQDRISRRSTPQHHIYPESSKQYQKIDIYDKLENSSQFNMLNTLDNIEKIENSFKKKSKSKPAKKTNHCDCSHSDLDSFSRYSINSYSKEDFYPQPVLSKARKSHRPSYRKLKPSQQVYIDQLSKVSKDEIFNLTKPNPKGKSTSNRPKLRNSIHVSPYNKRIPHSTSHSKERSANEKEVFVLIMMKVLQNHAKNCKSLRHEIDQVKFSKFFNV